MPKISLADKAAEKIRQIISNGELVSGAHINIDSLAREFGISQTPVREALRKLISEGRVVYSPKIGYSVRNMSLHEYFQVAEILQAIETHLVKELANAPLLIDAGGLRKINMELREAVKSNDRDLIGDVNDRFHAKLYENYPNKLMLTRLFLMWDEMHLRRNFMYNNPLFTARLGDEHEAIIQAIEIGDAEGAERAMRAHYVSGNDSALHYFP